MQLVKKGEHMTYEEMLQERNSIKSWVEREREAIIDLSKEMNKHLEHIDIYENKIKALERDILRYEVEQELKQKGVIE